MRHTFCLLAGRVTLRSLARAGLRREGHFRESGRYQGEWCAEVHFAVLAREWLG